VADLFIKALPATSIFKKHIRSIGMRHLWDLWRTTCAWLRWSICYTLFPLLRFLSQWVFPNKVFNEATYVPITFFSTSLQ
jgi:hypothetical protein